MKSRTKILTIASLGAFMGMCSAGTGASADLLTPSTWFQDLPRSAPRSQVIYRTIAAQTPTQPPQQQAAAPAPSGAVTPAQPQSAPQAAPAAPASAPAPATAQTQSQPQHVRPYEISLGSAKTDLGLDFERDGDTVVLHGMVFAECAREFTINNGVSSKDGKNYGFSITDSGRGLECQKAIRASGKNCATAEHGCVKLSEMRNAKLEMGGMGDISIGFFQVDPNVDSQDAHFENFKRGDKELKYVSPQTRERLAREAKEKAKLEAIRQKAEKEKAKIETLKRQVLTCRHNVDELETAHSALDLLFKLTGMSAEEYAKLDKQLTRAELNALSRKIARVKLSDPDAVQDLMEQLNAFNDEHQDIDGISETVARLYYDLAQRVANRPDATAADFAQAKEIVGQAADLQGLSDQSSKRLEGYKTQIDLASMQVRARSGKLDAFSFYSSYPALSEKLYNNYSSSCMSSGRQGFAEDCASAQSSLQTLNQIPQLAAQSIQQRQMQQAQMQMQMQRSMQMMTGFQGGGLNTFGAPGGISPLGNPIF